MYDPAEIELSNLLIFLREKDFKLYEKVHHIGNKMGDNDKPLPYNLNTLGVQYTDKDWAKFLKYWKAFKEIPE